MDPDHSFCGFDAASEFNATLHPPRLSENTSQIDWPQMSEIFHSKLSKQISRLDSDHAAVIPSPSAIETIQSEGRCCNIDLGYPPDIGVYEELSCKSPDWTAILMVLYWRMFQQSMVWAVFCYLLHKGTVDLECLVFPLDFFELSPNTHIITDLLLCFPSIQDICEQKASDRVPLQTSPWYSAIEWLAVVIARNGANIPQLVNEIEASGILGQIDEKKYSQFKEKTTNLDIPRNKHDAEKDIKRDYNFQVFGVWLPHGIGEDYELRHERLHAHLARAKEIANAYDQTLGERHGIILVLLDDVEETTDVSNVTTGEVSCILPVIHIFPYAEDLEMMTIDESDTENEGQKDSMPPSFWD
ncbi:hypothetical protein N7540_000609 [Penicillium herquei]|nr:hypothetical protein N7540_000609 [Penicillium herquei]